MWAFLFLPYFISSFLFLPFVRSKKIRKFIYLFRALVAEMRQLFLFLSICRCTNAIRSCLIFIFRWTRSVSTEHTELSVSVRYSNFSVFLCLNSQFDTHTHTVSQMLVHVRFHARFWQKPNKWVRFVGTDEYLWRRLEHALIWLRSHMEAICGKSIRIISC